MRGRRWWTGRSVLVMLLLAAGCEGGSAGQDGAGANDAGAASPTADAGALASDAAPAGDTGGGAEGRAPDAADADARAACATPLPDPKAAPPTVDVACFVSTFDEEFLAYDVSSGPLDDGLHPNERWFNGTEQCCMSPSGGLGGANYPSPGPNGPVNPYSLIAGGGLQIRAQRIGDTWFSGVMTSVDQNGNGFSQKFGYFEFNVQLAPGTGTWPGLWLLPLPMHSAGGEIDVLEQYGQNPPLDPATYTRFIMSVHDWSNAEQGTQFVASGLPDLTAGYHRIGLLWSDTYLALYFEGKRLWSTPTLKVMRQPYYLLADMGLGSGWDTSQTPSPSDLKIKWIRAYSVPGF